MLTSTATQSKTSILPAIQTGYTRLNDFPSRDLPAAVHLMKLWDRTMDDIIALHALYSADWFVSGRLSGKAHSYRLTWLALAATEQIVHTPAIPEPPMRYTPPTDTERILYASSASGKLAAAPVSPAVASSHMTMHALAILADLKVHQQDSRMQVEWDATVHYAPEYYRPGPLTFSDTFRMGREAADNLCSRHRLPPLL